MSNRPKASAIHAAARGKDYRRLNRGKMAAFALAFPRITNAVTVVGMAIGGFAPAWSRHLEQPIFGHDPRKALRKGLLQCINDVSKAPQKNQDDEDFFE